METIIHGIAGYADSPAGSATLTMLRADGPVEITWSALHHRARRMAAVLQELGVRPGDRVGLLGDTSIAQVTCLQAIWLAGASATVLPLPGLVAKQAHVDGLLAIADDADLSLIVNDTAIDLYGCRQPTLSIVDRMAEAMEPLPLRLPDPAELAVLQYTSGSTRAPRGVPVTHAHLAANVVAIKLAMGHQRVHPARHMSWLPLYHDMGLMGFLAVPMSCGCPLVLQSPSAFARRPASWFEALSRHRITTTGAPNFAYPLMTRLLHNGLEVDLSSLRCVLSGGEPIQPEAMEQFAMAAGRCGFDRRAVIAAYGLAESTLAVSMSSVDTGLSYDSVDAELLTRDGLAVPHDGPQAKRLTRVGRPVPGTWVRVVDGRSGAKLGERRVGHIEISGPSVVDRYWGDPPKWRGAWLRTGDLGYLADGELVVCGRAKDVLFTGGRNVHPQDVEVSACEVAGVRLGGAAAFGVPGPDGDRLIVVVEAVGTQRERLSGAVTVKVSHELGMSPSEVVVVRPGVLPRTTSGKLRRAETRRRYLDGELSLERTVP